MTTEDIRQAYAHAAVFAATQKADPHVVAAIILQPDLERIAASLEAISSHLNDIANFITSHSTRPL